MTRERRRPLKVGVELPIAVDKGRYGTPRWSDISLMARRAEEVGFDSVWIEDHLLFRHDGTGRTRACGRGGRSSPPSRR